MWARLAIAFGERDLARLRRSIPARDWNFWRAVEIVDGPIGQGPLAKLVALLLWTQFDTRKVGKRELLDLVETFVADPDWEPDPADEWEEMDEETRRERGEALERKLMAMFEHPDVAAQKERNKAARQQREA